MRRREFLQQGFAAAGMSQVPDWLKHKQRPAAEKFSCAFQLSVITDEISQDLGLAMEIAAKEFGLGYVELRTLWRKNIVMLDAQELAETKRLLTKYELKVTDIASPLFKTDWPGAPKSKYSATDSSYGADFKFEQQDEVLERAIGKAKALETERVRCFDFWRLDDTRPHRAAMDEMLARFSEKAAKQNVVLLLENEFACNTATGAEAARTLKAVTARNFLLNWDPGNAAYLGEKAFPDGHALLPKERIGHMHLKDVKKTASGGFDWEAMGQGLIDFQGQFRALLRDGYRGTMSLETHWNCGKGAEECSRRSMAGTKELLRQAGAA